MPRVNPIQNAFNAGEFGPKMEARVDIAQYNNAAKTALNLTALPQGGFARRAGTRYVAEVKDSGSAVRILPFQFSTSQAYILEAGEGYARFFRDQAQIFADDTDATITNGAFTSDISGWSDLSTGAASISHNSSTGRMDLIGSGADVAHSQQLVAVGATWTGNDHVIKFSVYGTPGDKIKLRIGKTSSGTEIINDEEFGVGFHCREFIPNQEWFYVQFLHSNGTTLSIDDVSLIDNAPIEIGSPYAEGSLFDIKTAQSADTLYMAVGGTTPVYKLLRLGALSWSLERVLFEDGPYLDSNVTATTLTPSATTGVGITITASSAAGINGGSGFSNTDVGRLVRIQHGANDPGYAVISAVSSATAVTADVKRDFNATTAASSWSLGAWSGTTGYPKTTTFYEQRLAFANTTMQPQTLWMSQSASLENFRPDSFVSSEVVVEADDSLNFTIAARELNAILWMSSEKQLVVGTYGGEWIVTSQSVTLTPTDIGVERHSTNGSRDAQAVLANGSTLFIQRSARQVFDYRFVFERDRFVGRDITRLAEHISRSTLKELTYQQQPDSLIFARRDDGQLAVVTYQPEEGVVGWTRFVLGGSFGPGNAIVESMATIPGEQGGGRVYDSNERDEAWMVVKRTINGVTKRYVEVQEGDFEGPIRHDYATDALWKAALLEAQKDAFYVDSGLTYSGVPTETLSGLDHLEGETVKILADGAIHPDVVVTGGSVTLEFAASKVQAGLPYFHEYQSLKLAFGAQAGTAVGKKKRVHGVTFVVLDTATFKYGRSLDALQNAEFRVVADAMDTAVPLFTGEVKQPFGGEWGDDPRIFIRSDSPAPFYLLAVAPDMKTNEFS